MSYRKDTDYIVNTGNFDNYLGIDFDVIRIDELRHLWLKTLRNGMHGLCFSIYEDGQQPGDVITEEQVVRRVQIIKPYTKWVRSFSCIEGNEHVARVAHKNGLKTLVGAWLGKDEKLNEQELKALIALGKEGCVDIAAVGNEVLYRNDLSKERLLRYINRVKAALPNIPIGYVDAYYEFTQHPDVVDACDVVLSNCYPYWEGCPHEYSLNHMQRMFGQATDAAKGKKVIITETGWPSKGENFKGAITSEDNAMKYFIKTQVWAAKENIELFYFSSFDESWKIGDEGDVGAYWGLWDKYENLKF
ncbi:glycoside hydrolase family 17 protein [Costertonia aggregata]|uniref:Endo-1,3-beta-glucanase btgC n=1 Tax=Costertonia aggregata TaxID=343403 RepID=A0A7H9AS35_9FLAO|nr:glycosyl hydrolase family 17 protein [Costertonia aggregata]QLG46217.1 glycosyl hydrolase [Costertonia aggregata]